MTVRVGGNIIAGAIAGSYKANTDMDNLTSQGKNIANWSSNVTNCITEIPQDIKLELNNGTLTLKAGSKVYMPNGFKSDGTTPKFDVVTIASDISVTKQTNDKCFVFYYNNSLFVWEISYATSGTTAPSGTGTWYDTTNNIIRRYISGSQTAQGLSLPLALLDVNSTAIQAIKQVFNGLGYIGSTVFALPGVKGLISNGRNVDGTLKNTKWNYKAVKTHSFKTNQNGFFYIKTNYAASIIDWSANFVVSDTQPTVTVTTLWYNPVNNIISQVLANGTVNINYQEIPIGYIILSSGVITSFTPKTAFHAVDYDDFADLKDEITTKAGLSSNNTFIGTNTFVTPALSDDSQKPVTTEWFNDKIVLVSSLPASPDANTFYFIPEA